MNEDAVVVLAQYSWLMCGVIGGAFLGWFVASLYYARISIEGGCICMACRQDLEPWSTWMHVKTRGTYTVIGVTETSTNGREGVEEVLYVSHTYQELRTRELSEFLDGRFERIPKGNQP